jgi:hypothetical protein
VTRTFVFRIGVFLHLSIHPFQLQVAIDSHLQVDKFLVYTSCLCCFQIKKYYCVWCAFNRNDVSKSECRDSKKLFFELTQRTTNKLCKNKNSGSRHQSTKNDCWLHNLVVVNRHRRIGCGRRGCHEGKSEAKNPMTKRSTFFNQPPSSSNSLG